MALRNPKVNIVDIIKPIQGHVVNGKVYTFIAKETFRLADAYWVCAQTDSWESDFETWDFLTEGRAGGKGALVRGAYSPVIKTRIRDLKLLGTSTQATHGGDRVQIVEEGEYRFSFSLDNAAASVNPTYLYEIQESETGYIMAAGSFKQSAATDGKITSGVFTLSPGSLLLRIKVRAEQPYLLPPGYKPTAAVTYIEDGKSWVYDPFYNIGKVPSDRNHPLLLQRAAILASGVQKDNPKWIGYLTGAGESDGEWTTLKILCQDSSSLPATWTYNESTINTAGPTLYRIERPVFVDQAQGGGTSSASYNDDLAENAFNGTGNDFWTTKNQNDDGGELPAYLTFDYGTGNEKIIKSYALLCGIGGPITWLPKSWQLEASNDDFATFDILQVITNSTIKHGQVSFFAFENDVAYKSYRIKFTASQSKTVYFDEDTVVGPRTEIIINEWQMFEESITNAGENRIYYSLDPMMRYINKVIYLQNDLVQNDGTVLAEAGSILAAGERSTPEGNYITLWNIKENVSTDSGLEAVVIATTPNPFSLTVEGSLQDHSATSIEISDNGDVFLLSKTTLYKLFVNRPTVTTRLLSYPLNTSGSPGGQALKSIGNTLYYAGEKLGSFSSVSPFFNAVYQVNGNQKNASEGTPFHGPMSIEKWMNNLWGVVEEKPTGYENAIQGLVSLGSSGWQRKTKETGDITTTVLDTSREFDAREYQWQHLINVNNNMLLFGKRGRGVPNDKGVVTDAYRSEEPIFALTDGEKWRELDFEFRVTKATPYPTDNPDVWKLLVIGYKVISGTGGNKVVDYENQYIAEVDYDGRPVMFTWDRFLNCFVSDLVAEASTGNEPGSLCGPTDVAFIIDDTGSMGGTLESVKNELLDTMNLIHEISGGDYRMSVVSFKDDVTVHVPFGAQNDNDVIAAISALTAGGGGDEPEASSAALQTVVDELAERPGQNGDFTPFRKNVLKIAILVTDAHPHDIGISGYEDGRDDVFAHEMAVKAMEKGILVSAVYVPTYYNQRIVEIMQDYAATTGGQYLETERSGAGAGAAFQEILANCGGLRFPKNTGNIEDFAPYWWWLDGEWVLKNNPPEDNTFYLTRTITNGKVSYCAPCPERMPEDNFAFVYDADDAGFVMLDFDVKSRLYINSSDSLPDYLNWEVDEWVPSDIAGTTFLEKQILATPDRIVYVPGGALPYAITADTNDAIQYGGLSPWGVRPRPQTLLIYRDADDQFVVSIENLKYRYGLEPTDSLLDAVINFQGYCWDNDVATTDYSLTKSVTATEVIYQGTGSLPYDASDWCNRGLLRNDHEWCPVDYDSPTWYCSCDRCTCYCIDKELLERDFGITPNMLPPFLVWDSVTGCWLPSATEPTDTSVSYLELSVNGDLVCYSLVQGSTPEPNCPVDGYGGISFVTIDGPWCTKKTEVPIIVWRPSTNSFCGKIAELRYHYGIRVELLPDFLSWLSGSQCWVPETSEPTTGLYLEKTVGTERFCYELKEVGNLSPEWPYDVTDWDNRALAICGNKWCSTEVGPPIVPRGCSEDFCILIDYLDSFGLEPSDLPQYLVLNNNTLCWVPATEVADNQVYLEQQLSVDTMCYIQNGSLPSTYDLISYPGIAIGSGATDPWCPRYIQPATLQWDDGVCFWIERSLLQTVYGITDLSCLPPYIVWDGECWIPSDTASGVYLEKFVSGSRLSYCLTTGSLPYDPNDPAYGRGILLGWNSRYCPVIIGFPYNPVTCPVIRLIGDKPVVGKIIAGVFVPCDPDDADDAEKGMPPGTLWKIIYLPPHGAPVNMFELVDTTLDHRLTELDRRYRIAWYREAREEDYIPITKDESGNFDPTEQSALLKTFNKRVRFERLTKTPQPYSRGIEVIVLAAPQLERMKVPAIARII